MRTQLYTVSRDSFLKRLDFRSKLVMMFAIPLVALLWDDPLMSVILSLVIIISCILVGIKWIYLRIILYLTLPFYLLMLLFQGFTNVEHVLSISGQAALTPLFTFPGDLWLIGNLSLTLEGLLYGLTIICKTISMTLVIPLGIFTSNLDNMLASMVKARIPYKIAFIFSATLRFFPLLIDNAASITEAQRLRGLAFEEMNWFKRIRVYARIAIPLILTALAKSQQLEVILQAKGFTGDSNRTYLHDSSLNFLDYAFISVMSLFLVASILGYIFFGIGKFSGAI